MPVVLVIGGLRIKGSSISGLTYSEAAGARLARHNILRGPVKVEVTGAEEDTIMLDGMVAPYEAFSSLELATALKEMLGTKQLVMRGDMTVKGWYMVERMEAEHEYIGAAGVGRAVYVSAELVKTDKPPVSEANGSLMTNVRKWLGF